MFVPENLRPILMFVGKSMNWGRPIAPIRFKYLCQSPNRAEGPVD